MANFTFTATNGDVFSPTAATNDFFFVDDISHLQNLDNVDATINESTFDIIELRQTTPGVISLSASLFPLLIGFEQLRIGPSITAAFTFNLDYSWAAQNFNGSLPNFYHLVMLQDTSGSHYLSTSGTYSGKDFSISLGSGNNTVVGGSGKERIDLSKNTVDSINLAGGNDEVYITQFFALSVLDTIDGGLGNDKLLFYTNGNISDTAFSATTGFEDIDFLAQGGDLAVTIPSSFGSGVIKSNILNGAGTVKINHSSGINALDIVANFSPNSATIHGGNSADTLRGASVADSINGGSGPDAVYPGAGVDTIVTGIGADTIFYGNSLDADGDYIADMDGGDVIKINGAAFSGGFSSTVGDVNAGFVGKAWLSTDGQKIFADTDSDGIVNAFFNLLSPQIPGDFTAAGSTITRLGGGILFTLTTGSDVPVLTPSSDTVRGSLAELQAGDVIDGGTGADILEMTAGPNFDLRIPGTLANIERFLGTTGNDRIILNSPRGITAIEGGAGTDILHFTNMTLDMRSFTATLQDIEELYMSESGTTTLIVRASDIAAISAFGANTTSDTGIDTLATADATMNLVGKTLTNVDQLQSLSATGTTITPPTGWVGTITGSAGNDIVAHEFSSTSTVNGGLGTDTLSYALSTGGSVDFRASSTIAGFEVVVGSANADGFVMDGTTGGVTSIDGGAASDRVIFYTNTIDLRSHGLALTQIENLDLLATGTATLIVRASELSAVQAFKTVAGGGNKGVLATAEAMFDLTGKTLVTVDRLEALGTAGTTIIPPAGWVGSITGGAGGDVFSVALGNTSTIDGGSGYDTLLLTGAGTFTIPATTGIEAVLYDGGTAQTLTLPASDSRAFGTGSNNDVVVGSTDNDRIFLGAGNDNFTGGNGSDLAIGEAGSDTLDGGSGADTLFGGSLGSSLNGGTESDTIVGGGGDDTILGGSDNAANLIFGGAGNDSITGAGVLVGGVGADTLIGASGADTLFGEAGANVLNGGSGDDILVGGADAETIIGGLGNDTLWGSSGVDRFNMTTDTSTDVIADFQVGVDKLDLSALGISAAGFAALTQTPMSNGVTLVLSGTQSISLIGLTTLLVTDVITT